MGNRHKKRGNGGQPEVPSEVKLEGRESQSRPSASPGTVPLGELELRDDSMPAADALVRYGHAHPNAPAIILDEFQRQGAHRRRLECRDQFLDRKALEASIASERIGVACALLIALVGFACATYLVTNGNGVAGTVIFGLDVGALVSAFLLGRPRAVVVQDAGLQHPA
jgi:uncharacterized membrane protein